MELRTLNYQNQVCIPACRRCLCASNSRMHGRKLFILRFLWCKFCCTSALCHRLCHSFNPTLYFGMYITGAVRDHTGSYDIVSYMAMGFFTLGWCGFIVSLVLKMKSKKNDKALEIPDELSYNLEISTS